MREEAVALAVVVALVPGLLVLLTLPDVVGVSGVELLFVAAPVAFVGFLVATVARRYV